MASIFQKFWQWLTGKSSDTTAPSGGYQTVPVTVEEPGSPVESDPDPSVSDGPDVTMTLSRGQSGESGLAGTIDKANTLEDTTNQLPAGQYALSLKDKGGLHSAYWYRFPDLHKGMIQIGEGGRFIRLGESGKDAQGGVVIQQIDEYLAVYTKVAEELSAGKKVELIVS